MTVLETDTVRVEFDDSTPRVVRYTHTPTGHVLNGSVPGLSSDDYLWVRHTGGLAGSSEFWVEPDADREPAAYRVTLTNVPVAFDMRYTLAGDTLSLRIGNVADREGARLLAVDLTSLAMVSNSDASWSICTSEWERKPFAEFHHGLRQAFDFAAFLHDDLAVALTSNRPLHPANLDWQQTFPGPEQWTAHHVLTFPVYARRLGGELQPDFEGWIGLFGDRTCDGAIDWRDVAHWVRGFTGASMSPLYRNTWVTKISTASPPDRLHTTFDQCLDLVRTFAERVRGTVPEGSPLWIVYLSGWQYEGHDSKWPSVGRVCERCGSTESARRLVAEARQLGVNVSLHLNWDDLYADSPDFSPAIAAVGADGELLKGATWGGGQAYYVCSAKDVASGAARRRMRELLDLWPIRDTVHFDVLSSNTWTHSLDPGHPISRLENIVLGKWKILDMFRDEAGLDITSEGCTWPFLVKIGYFWGVGDDYRAQVKRYLLHGRAMYGGGGGPRDMSEVRRQVFRRASIGAGISQNVQANTPIEGITDLYYLVFLPYRLLADTEIRSTWEKGGRFGTRFEDGSETWGEPDTQRYEVRVRDRLVAKDHSVFLPCADRWIAYSMDGGSIAYPAPDGWVAGPVSCRAIDSHDDPPGARAEVKDGRIELTLPPHRGVWVGPDDPERSRREEQTQPRGRAEESR